MHTSKTFKCEKCGHVVTPPEDFDPDYDESFTTEEGETFHWINEEWLCEDCCFYCDYHQRWERGEGTEVYDGDIVCDSALSDSYFFCDICCEYHPNEEESKLDDVCADCFAENYYICEKCGEIVKRGDTCVCQDPDYGKIEKKEVYSEGDYVIIGTDLHKTQELCALAPGMTKTIGLIGKVAYENNGAVRVYVSSWTSWAYAKEDIVGAIKVHKNSNLYKKYEEVFGREPEVAE